jgi:hypothetical protein
MTDQITTEDFLGETEILDMKQMDALIRESVRLWAESDAKKKVYTEAYNKADEQDLKIMHALRRAGKKKYYVEGLGTFYIKTASVVRVPKTLEEKRKFFNHLMDLGEDVFYGLASVNSSTLNGWYDEKEKEAQKQGTLIFQIPGIESPTTRETACFTKER